MLPPPDSWAQHPGITFNPLSALSAISHLRHCPVAVSPLPHSACTADATCYAKTVLPSLKTFQLLPSADWRKTQCFRQACKAFCDPAPAHLPISIHHGPFLQFDSHCWVLHHEIGILYPNKGVKQSLTDSYCTSSEPLKP